MMRFLLGFLPVVILVVGFIFYENKGSTAVSSDTQPSVLVTTMPLTPGGLAASISAYGTVMAPPNAETTISLQASGIVSGLAVTAGQRIAAGDPLATILADAQSVADYKKAVGALDAARINRAHVAALLVSHLTTNADLAAADQVVADATGSLKALNATGAGKTRTITAPFAGFVSAILVASGSAQPAGTPLLRIINTNGLVAVVGVPPVQAGAISAGQTAKISLLNSGGTAPGSVAQSSALLDPLTGLTNVTLSFAGSAPLGEPVLAIINTGTMSGYIVPRDAVQNDQNGDYAFQVDTKNIAHRVSVHVLGTQGGQTVIAPGLNPAMPLVTKGAYQLDDGAAVRMDSTGGASH